MDSLETILETVRNGTTLSDATIENLENLAEDVFENPTAEFAAHTLPKLCEDLF